MIVIEGRVFVIDREILILFPIMKTPISDYGVVMVLRSSKRWSGRVGGGVGVGGEPLLLPLPGLVVLKPIKDILALNLAVAPEPSTDGLNLISRGGPDSIDVVELLEKLYLLCCGCPPSAALPAKVIACTYFSTPIVDIFLL